MVCSAIGCRPASRIAGKIRRTVQTQRDNQDWRDETRTILGISVPLTAAFVAEMGMVITDMIIVGRLGSNELAAVGLAGDWFWVLLLIGMGVISIVGVIAAQCLGAGDDDGVKAASEQGMIAATVTSVPVMLCVWYLGPVLGWAKQDPEIVRLITDYAHVITWGRVPCALVRGPAELRYGARTISRRWLDYRTGACPQRGAELHVGVRQVRITRTRRYRRRPRHDDRQLGDVHRPRCARQRLATPAQIPSEHRPSTNRPRVA